MSKYTDWAILGVCALGALVGIQYFESVRNNNEMKKALTDKINAFQWPSFPAINITMPNITMPNITINGSMLDKAGETIGGALKGAVLPILTGSSTPKPVVQTIDLSKGLIKPGTGTTQTGILSSVTKISGITSPLQVPAVLAKVSSPIVPSGSISQGGTGISRTDAGIGTHLIDISEMQPIDQLTITKSAQVGREQSNPTTIKHFWMAGVDYGTEQNYIDMLAARAPGSQFDYRRTADPND